MNRLRLEENERTEDSIIKDIKNLFRLKKENEPLEIISDIRNLSEHEEKDYYKPVRVGKF